MSHSKTAFQLERLILFSDAVFAIAITLLIIEIKVPHLLPEYTTGQVMHAYLELTPRFLGFFVSFFFIGLYWTVHHQLMGYVVNYTPGLIWLNLLFLLSIVLFPFSTALDSEYATSNFISPSLIYTLNLIFSGVMIAILWRYISNPQRQLSEGLDNPLFVQYQQRRALTVPLIFGLVFLVGLLLPFHSMGRTLLPVIPFVMRYLKRRYDKSMLKLPEVPVAENSAEEV